MPVEIKHLAIVKAFDQKLSGEWHSGSCTFFTTKIDCNTREEGEAFIKDTIENHYRNNTERYRFNSIVLSYAEKDTDVISKMFKYM